MSEMQPLTVPGTLDSLKPIRDYVTAASEAADLGKKAAYRLRLAVDEIATNIVTHGYDEAGLEGSVKLCAQIDNETLTIVIEDTGIAYDPRQAESPDDMDLPADQRQIGGLGMYLVFEYVDQLHYERIGDKNRQSLIVNRSPES